MCAIILPHIYLFCMHVCCLMVILYFSLTPTQNTVAAFDMSEENFVTFSADLTEQNYFNFSVSRKNT